MSKAEAKAVVEPVHGVDLKKVDKKHLAGVLTEHGVKVLSKATSADLVTSLVEHYRVNPPKMSSAPCGVCGGISDYDLKACPFCGLDDAETASGAEKPPIASVSAGTSIVKVTSTEVVKDDLKVSSSIKGVRELDEAVTEIQDLKSRYAASYWELGAKLAQIYTSDLWMLRVGEDGKSKYKAFEAFTLAELGINPQAAYKAMDISREYTRQQVLTWGKTRLGILLQVPEEARKAMLEEMEKAEESGKKAPSTRQLAEKAGQIKKETGYKVPTHAKDGRGGSQPGKKDGRPREEKITIASIMGRQKLKLYKKPATKKYEESELVEAKKLGDQPFAIEHLTNNVTRTYSILQTAAGHLQLVIETKRDAEE